MAKSIDENSNNIVYKTLVVSDGVCGNILFPVPVKIETFPCATIEKLCHESEKLVNEEPSVQYKVIILGGGASLGEDVLEVAPIDYLLREEETVLSEIVSSVMTPIESLNKLIRNLGGQLVVATMIPRLVNLRLKSGVYAEVLSKAYIKTNQSIENFNRNNNCPNVFLNEELEVKPKKGCPLVTGQRLLKRHLYGDDGISLTRAGERKVQGTAIRMLKNFIK